MNAYSSYQTDQQPQINSIDGTKTNSTDAVTLAQTQPSLVWNGSQWVSTLASVNYLSSSSSNNLTESSGFSTKVAMYTSFYHNWNASYLKFTDMKSLNVQYKDLDNQIQWAKYYADLSSQAAHFFFNNPTAITAPFQLPPAPLDNNMLASELQPLKQTQPHPNTATGHGEVALKRYVDRCLLQCKSQQDKNQMVQLIESMIQHLLQTNQFNTMNWDTKLILQLNFTSPKQTKAVQEYKTQHSAVVGADTSVAPFDKYMLSNGFIASQTQPLPSFSVKHDQITKNSSNTFNNSNNTTGTKRKLDDATASFGYYGPSSAETNYVAQLTARQSKKQNRINSMTLLDRRNSESTIVDSGYYGPNPTPNMNTFRHSEDFISLSSGNKQPQKRHEKRLHGGFVSTDAALNDRSKRFGEIRSRIKDDDINSEIDGFMGKGAKVGLGGIGKNLIILDESDYEKMTIKGTCETLEKDYLRLTAPPRAEMVRPLHILQQHFIQVKDTRSNASFHNQTGNRDYLWFCSQLKAIRQDCTVQRIQNSFAVDVYETHARYALEEDDLNEYNQCQTQLEELYKLHSITLTHGNYVADNEKALSNRNEFIAYRVVYHVFLTGNTKYSGGSSDLLKIMATLTCDQLRNDAVKHALKVQEACCNVDLLNYHSFFHLYATCPNHGKYLMKHMVPFVRHNALLRICKGYRPGVVETEFVAKELGFLKHDEGREWLRSCNCILSKDDSQLITRDSYDLQESVMEEKKSLI